MRRRHVRYRHRLWPVLVRSELWLRRLVDRRLELLDRLRRNRFQLQAQRREAATDLAELLTESCEIGRQLSNQPRIDAVRAW